MRKTRIYSLSLAVLLITLVIAGGGCSPAASETPTTQTASSTSTTGVTPSATPAATTQTTKTVTTVPTTDPSQTVIQSLNKISVTDAYKLMQNNQDNPDFIIVDIRTQEEYDGGHLEGAILKDYYNENFRSELSKLDRNKQYLVYCRTARRSGLAMEVFKSLGFANVLDMSGGIAEWQAQGYPVVK